MVWLLNQHKPKTQAELGWAVEQEDIQEFLLATRAWCPEGSVCALGPDVAFGVRSSLGSSVCASEFVTPFRLTVSVWE